MTARVAFCETMKQRPSGLATPDESQMVMPLLVVSSVRVPAAADLMQVSAAMPSYHSTPMRSVTFTNWTYLGVKPHSTSR